MAKGVIVLHGLFVVGSSQSAKKCIILAPHTNKRERDTDDQHVYRAGRLNTLSAISGSHVLDDQSLTPSRKNPIDESKFFTLNPKVVQPQTVFNPLADGCVFSLIVPWPNQVLGINRRKVAQGAVGDISAVLSPANSDGTYTLTETLILVWNDSNQFSVDGVDSDMDNGYNALALYSWPKDKNVMGQHDVSLRKMLKDPNGKSVDIHTTGIPGSPAGDDDTPPKISPLYLDMPNWAVMHRISPFIDHEGCGVIMGDLGN